MKTIKEIIMKKDDLTAEEADQLIKEAHDQFDEYIDGTDMDSAEEICEEFFGLEADYLVEFF